MAIMYLFSFSCIDNGGKRQAFTVKAANKAAAIDKGLAKAKKAAKGDITNWHCTFVPGIY